MGESGSGKIVTEVKNRAEKIAKEEKAELLLVDSAAGIGCPVIASIQGSDFIVAVVEPSPSAFSDLKRALQVVNHFQIPYGIVINRWDLNKEFSKEIEKWIKKEKIKLLGRFPFDRAFVDAVVKLTPIVIYDKKYTTLFKAIVDKLNEIIKIRHKCCTLL